MKTCDLKNQSSMRPLKLALHEVPHITIEPSMMCNLRCKCCYKVDRSYLKPLDDVKREVDLACAKRNLETVSIVGGEPTLYPHLIGLVSYIKSKNLICQILTNGITFLKETGDQLLNQLVKVGLDRIILHIDRGQGYSEEQMLEITHTLFTKFEKRKIFFSLSVTIYHENNGVVPKVLKEFGRYRYFDGILTTQARNTQNTVTAEEQPSPDLVDVHKVIERELSVQPASYIPSNFDDNEISWLMYFYYMNMNTHKTFAISPLFNRIFRALYRLIAGRHVFAVTTKPGLFFISLFFTLFFEILLHPSRLGEVYRLLRKSSWAKALRFHYILMQSGPVFDPKRGKMQLCYHCPDATIRNGKVTPVCLADIVNPIQNNSANRMVDPELYNTIYEHMGEV